MFFACVDIGGTFSDLVLYSDDAGLEIFKAPTTPGEFERGFVDCFGLAAKHHGMSLGDFLAEVELIVHGTTVSTNALVESEIRTCPPFPALAMRAARCTSRPT